MIYSKILKSSPSKLVNAWKVKVDGKCYIVTPAHVCMHVVDKKWAFSSFLIELKQLDWHLPLHYVANPNPFFDLAWAEVDVNDDFIPIEGTMKITEPSKVDVYFRQPLSWEGTWQSNNSEIGSREAVLYPTPSTSNVVEGEIQGDPAFLSGESLLEAIDTGFRGMSGAIAIQNERCAGMLVMRGYFRELKRKRIPTFQFSNTLQESSTAIPPDDHDYDKKEADEAVVQYYSRSQRFVRSFLGLDQMEARIEANLRTLDRRLGNVESALTYLIHNGLVREDLHELAVVIDARRGIFLPSNIMAKLIQQETPSINVKSLIGQKAPVLRKQ